MSSPLFNEKSELILIFSPLTDYYWSAANIKAIYLINQYINFYTEIKYFLLSNESK